MTGVVSTAPKRSEERAEGESGRAGSGRGIITLPLILTRTPPPSGRHGCEVSVKQRTHYIDDALCALFFCADGGVITYVVWGAAATGAAFGLGQFGPSQEFFDGHFVFGVYVRQLLEEQH